VGLGTLSKKTILNTIMRSVGQSPTRVLGTTFEYNLTCLFLLGSFFVSAILFSW